MRDPATLAAITAAISVLGDENAKGIASEAGKNTWQTVKDLLGWKTEPPVADMATEASCKLEQSPALVQQILELLKSRADIGTAASMVSEIEGEIRLVAQNTPTDPSKM